MTRRAVPQLAEPFTAIIRVGFSLRRNPLCRCGLKTHLSLLLHSTTRGFSDGYCSETSRILSYRRPDQTSDLGKRSTRRPDFRSEHLQDLGIQCGRVQISLKSVSRAPWSQYAPSSSLRQIPFRSLGVAAGIVEFLKCSKKSYSPAALNAPEQALL